MKSIVPETELINLIAKEGKDILQSLNMQYEKKLPMHSTVNVFKHSLSVAYYSVYLIKKHGWKVDVRSVIRGALLHDYFLYDWHQHEKCHRLHGFRHARFALRNAEREYQLNPIEKDIILKHMFPVNIKLPRYKESYIVDWADKVCAHYEIHRGEPKIDFSSLLETAAETPIPVKVAA
jgi:uncharacterized protein